MATRKPAATASTAVKFSVSHGSKGGERIVTLHLPGQKAVIAVNIDLDEVIVLYPSQKGVFTNPQKLLKTVTRGASKSPDGRPNWKPN